MRCKNPRTGQSARASVSTAADKRNPTQNHPDLQPASLAELRALHITETVEAKIKLIPAKRRRNITAAWRIELALANKEDLAAIGKAQMSAGGKVSKANEGLSENDKPYEQQPHNTRVEIAKAANTSTGMVAMAEQVRKKAPTPVKLDEISTFLGDIPADEYERRAKLRSYRNAASAMIASTPCDTARYLAWEVVEWVTPNLYAPAPLAWLEQLNQLAKRLMLTAIQAEQMQQMLQEAEADNG